MIKKILAVLAGLTCLFWIFYGQAGNLGWKASIVLPGELKQEISLPDGEKKFFLPATKWSCFVTPVEKTESVIKREKITVFQREIRCLNLRDKDKVVVPIHCFDLPDQVDMKTLLLTDEKNKTFEISVSCSPN